MRILGIDPGTQILGYGVVDLAGSRAERVESGVIVTGEGPLEARLAILFEGLERVVAKTRPEVVAVEDIFHARNLRSALALGHARGVALLVAGRAGLVVHAYAPSVVKKSVVGHGRAEKEQVQKMVRALLGLSAEPRTDEADALAIALCHGQHSAFHSLSVASAPERKGVPKSKGAGRVLQGGTRVIDGSELAAAMSRAKKAKRRSGR